MPRTDNFNSDLQNLAKYYRDLLRSVSTQAGKHFVDINKVIAHGLTTDLGVFVQEIGELISGESISFKIERVFSPTVSKIIQKANDFEESEERAEQIDLFDETPITLEEQERQNASAVMVAIYRKQQFDPYNREIVIGFPLLTGKYGRKRICTPLFYNKVMMEFDPLKNLVTLTKETEIPALNFQLIKHVVESDEEVEIIRKQILPDLHVDDFDLCTVKKIIQKLSQLIPGLGGLEYAPEKVTLKTALELSNRSDIRVVNASTIINARRTNAHLLDDLASLSQVNEFDDDTVVNTMLSEPEDANIIEDTDDPASSEGKLPLLFPLQSNKRQRLAAVKAENSRLFVIQGPPGTGKSQTIVNIVCHSIAHGKTVLVSSHQNKALEVIRKNMPSIDYLAMSLLKSEKESIKELTNKIDGFQSYITHVDAREYGVRINNLMNELIEKDRSSKKLQVRFSELKTLERDNHSHYRKYHDIRNYDIIDPQDTVPSGMDSIVAQALTEYSSLIAEMNNNECYAEIEKCMPLYDHSSFEDAGDNLILQCKQCSKRNKVPKARIELDAKCGACGHPVEISRYDIQTSIENIKKLMDTYDWIKQNILDDSGVHTFCNSLRGSSPNKEIGAYLDGMLQWIARYGDSLVSGSRTLSQSYDSEVDFDSLRRLVAKIGDEIIDIESRAKTLSEKTQLLRKYDADDNLPGYPDINVLEEVGSHLSKLISSSKSWASYHFPLRFRRARKKVKSHLSLDFRYRNRKKLLEAISNWHFHWHLRYQVINDIKWFMEMDIPVKAFDSRPSVGAIHETARYLDNYIKIISAIHALPSPVSDDVEGFINDEIANCFVANDIAQFLKCVKKSKQYFELRDQLKDSEKDSHFKYLCTSLYPAINKAVFDLTVDINTDKIADRLKKISPHFSQFMRLKTLERSELKTLPQSFNKIRNTILKGDNIAELESPDLVLESFRLASFMREDLIKNPDDINEVVMRIRQLKEESRDLILKILNAKRKKSLKEAESNPRTRFQIRHLKEILKRKKKTYSFVQLREQIEYKRLLSFFPCWIMSIEDVARIFPLQAGLFDYLIVDEASQCNQATALHLAYRAQRMIVVGDSKQMKNPNTQFLSDPVVRFNLTKHGLDRHPKAEFFHGRKSLLDLADGCSDTASVFLNEHFRCEPPLIAFSNEKFYDRALRILTPFRSKHFNPCMEIKLINGAFDDPDGTKQNEIEADAVIAELKRMIDRGELEGDKKGKKLSVGLLSPFRNQASLLQSKMYEAFEEDPSKIKEYDIIASTVDGFQGDERDVILYSFRYAPNSKPGSIIALQRESDEHSLGRINVAFSRPRRKAICFISVPKEKFPSGLIRDYLDHAAIEFSRPTTRLGNPNEREKCQSDFERHIFDDLTKEGLQIYSQAPCDGFFIDFVVVNHEGKRMAVECDGDFHYEDGELREEDYQRQDIIERYGWFVYRIPSRRYYADPRGTITHLLETLKQQTVDEEISGFSGESEYTTKPEEIRTSESLEEEASSAYDEQTEQEGNIEDKIIDLLSKEGPMPTWMIAGKIKLPRDETNNIMQSLAEKEWVISSKENGVKKWKEIL